MQATHYSLISKALSIPDRQVNQTAALLDGGATVPFIARYRKEATGGLDEVQIAAVRDRLQQFREVDQRRAAILKSIEAQGLLDDALRAKLAETWSMTALEDLYLPFRPKRKTRASVARERGLEPLAKILMAQRENDPEGRARGFCGPDVPDAAQALKGARDIIAEWVNEHRQARYRLRRLYQQEATISAAVVKGAADDDSKYRDYFDHREPLRKCASHRLLAMRRGEEEGVLKVKIQVPEATAMGQLEPLFLKGSGPATEHVQQAIKDGYKRLLAPAMETEFRQDSKERADREAIRVFQANLRQLLLGAPLGQKRVLAIDPGFRTGCKLVCLDEQGKLLHNETIYPHPPQRQTKVAAAKVKTLVEQYKVEAIAVGNGTAGRETEQFLGYIRFKTDVKAFMVSENGASVYSASKVARDEFPQYDVTVRGAVSIGRRLMDPLAELVKIEPKAIGVGQYQHDVDQAMLLDSLDQVVTSCVNQVGVNLNTASKHLLTYVSGLGPQLAENIVLHRKEHGLFRSRKELLKVARMGPKAFEQAAGFLRIPGAEFPLDNSAVHPERYALVRQMARDLNVAVEALIGPTGQSDKVEAQQYLGEGIGLPTLNDILEELKKPGRDPRKKAEAFQFDQSVHRPEDLEKGMVLPGIVTNITNFGAFVDVGVKQDGLVHISELADRFVRDPNEVVALHQQVRVRVLEVDLARKRIAFSMRALPEEA